MSTEPSATDARHGRRRLAGSVFAAVDIGASSGRVILGRVTGSPGGARAELETVHRFPNGVKELDGGLRWDFDALFAEVLTGLAAAATAAAARGESIASIGIDTWAVDYGLVNAAGDLVAAPFSYRDDRSRAAVARVHQHLDPARLYATTGLQFLPFNTIYQLATETELEGLQALLIPDLIGFLLTGRRRTEATNASTTGLFDAVAGEWATEFLSALGLPEGPVPAADPARRDGRHPAAGDRGTDRPARKHRRGGRRLARHRLGRRRRARGPARLRLHLLGHLVPGRRRTVPPGPDRGQPGRELHQRTRRGRHHPLPAQRRRPLAAQRVPAHVGAGGLPAGTGGTARRRRGPARRRPAHQRRRPLLHRPRQHARAHPGRGPQHRSGPPGASRAHRAVHPGQPRRRLRPDHHRRRAARGPERRRRAHCGRRIPEPAPVPAHRRRHRQARDRRPRGSHGAGQRPGPGPRRRRAQRRAGGAARRGARLPAPGGVCAGHPSGPQHQTSGGVL